MKQASECLRIAVRCETLALDASAASSIRQLHELAEQWRKLANDSERHKRLIWTLRPQPERQQP